MRNQPLLISRITMKSAANMIINTASAHINERLFCHLAGFLIRCLMLIAEQKHQVVGGGKFRFGSKPGITFIVLIFKLTEGVLQYIFGNLFYRRKNICLYERASV